MKKINNNLPRGGAEWGRALRRFLSDNIVPIMFVLICAYCIPRADLSWNYLLNEGMTRLGRNAFLILSLLIPVMAGMGMNFGMTLGAMAGQIGLIFAADWQVWGIPGLILAAIISIPISVLLGIMIGKLLNRAKGREMITSYMIAFAMDGVYQFFVLFMMGPVIPIIHNTLKLPRGYGIRNTVSLLNMRQSLDNLLAVSVGGVKIPRAHAHYHCRRLPLYPLVPPHQARSGYARGRSGYGGRARRGHQCRAYPRDLYGHLHRVRGLRHDHLFAERRQLPHLYRPYPDRYVLHRGAARRWCERGEGEHQERVPRCYPVPHHVHRGAAHRTVITGDSMIGEYFRVFVSYAVITIALVMYEAKKRKAKSAAGLQLAADQLAEEEAKAK